MDRNARVLPLPFGPTRVVMPGRIVTVPPGFPDMTSSGIAMSVTGAAAAAMEGGAEGSSDTGNSWNRNLLSVLVAAMLYDRNVSLHEPAAREWRWW
jgi:hypothetical protein